jgi:hypothetical protein
MKSFRAISRVSMELQSSFLDIISVVIIGAEKT